MPTTRRPAWWPLASAKPHADAGCRHPDECFVDTATQEDTAMITAGTHPTEAPRPVDVGAETPEQREARLRWIEDRKAEKFTDHRDQGGRL